MTAPSQTESDLIVYRILHGFSAFAKALDRGDVYQTATAAPPVREVGRSFHRKARAGDGQHLEDHRPLPCR